MAEPAATLPKGSLILITGLTGYIATHVGQQFLKRGYKVRGTVRDLAKAAWLKDDLFSAEHAAGNLELVQVQISEPPMPLALPSKGLMLSLTSPPSPTLTPTRTR
ncbi:hypothetical protein TGAMA5MH_06858 [Trichoderma gamsii]|uniref:NAD-dependent epimerase/dehydratase domain-containing protein n=1 Tax=Trichoderma gamsii TaxID=398673 RepID=A0A2K0T635_9HYPO|nr:hypothetical protein TGAMA5MH_06858 [Trichoderma gamsii]